MTQKQPQQPQQGQPQQPQPQQTQAPQAQAQQATQGLSPQHVQALAACHPQHLQAAAQLGEELQRSGLNAGNLFKLVGLLQKYGPLLGGLATDLQSIFGQQAPEAAGQQPRP